MVLKSVLPSSQVTPLDFSAPQVAHRFNGVALETFGESNAFCSFIVC